MTPLSELIRIMRKKALMSQEDFAKTLNVSVGTIHCFMKSVISTRTK